MLQVLSRNPKIHNILRLEKGAGATLRSYVRQIEDPTRVVILYEIYETSLRRL